MSVIKVNDVYKKFKVYLDKGQSVKERLLFRKRNRYEERVVLNGVSFEVEKGEAVGLIGHNGCGKSTLLKLLTKIMYPDNGSLTVEGRVSSLIELGAGFHPDMSGRENIYTNASIFGLTKKEINERLEEIIEFSELRQFIDNPVRTYSSGMYMRLAFAVAINVDADVLLIDEILAVGDTNFQSKCLRKLRELKSSGVTIVLVSHDMNVVETFCNKVIWLNSGNIQSIGKSKSVIDNYLEFMNKELYESMRSQEESRQGKNTREEVKADEKPESEDPAADESDDADKIDYQANRFGLKYVEITNAGFVNAKGQITSILKSGESAELRIYYKINKPISNYNFGMGFYTLDNICIYGVNTELDGYEITDLPDEGYITFKVDEVLLLTGRYILQVAVVDGNGTPMDYYHNFSYFDVVSTVKAIGINEIKHNWIIQNRE